MAISPNSYWKLTPKYGPRGGYINFNNSFKENLKIRVGHISLGKAPSSCDNQSAFLLSGNSFEQAILKKK